MFLRTVCRRLPRCPQPAALTPCQTAHFCDKQPKSQEKSAYTSLLDNLCQQKMNFREETEKKTIEGSVSSSAVNSLKHDGAALRKVLLSRAEKFVANLDEDGLKRMEDIKYSIEMLKAENKRVPEELSPYHWMVLLTEHHTYNSRAKYLAKVCVDEWRRNTDYRKKGEKQKERQEKLERMKEKTFDYSVWSIPRPERDVLEKNWKKLRAMKSDIDIVFDMDYEQRHREMVNTADQLTRCWSLNNNHLQPLNIHLTSIHQCQRMHDILNCTPVPPVNFYEENVFEVFPNKEDLIYLTPDGPQMKEFDPTKTYIIGGIVDLSGRTRLAYGKAKAHGIRTASFPLNRYCNFCYTTRARYILTLDVVLGIMLDLYFHHSWMVALRNNLNSRYLFWEDMENPELFEAQKKLSEKMAFRKFERQKNYLKKIQN